jgi:hypothetical protein
MAPNNMIRRVLAGGLSRLWNSARRLVRPDVRTLIPIAVVVFLAQTASVSAQSTPASFNPLVNVSNTAGQVSDRAAVTADGATIYVAWHEEVAGGQQIRLRRSTNGGVSFIDGTAGRVAATVDPAETVHTVRIAASGAVVYVLYTSGVETRLAKARLALSIDGGVTFAAPITLADTVEFGGSAFADVAVDGTGAVHVVIEDREFSDDILYLFSTDQGVTFSTPAALAGSPEPSVRPRMAARGAQLAVTWEELVTGASELAFIYSADAGASFGAVQNLSANAADSKGPAVAIGNLIHVAWAEGDSLMLRSSIDGAAFTLAAPIGVAPPAQIIAGFAVASSVNTVHMGWTTVDVDGLMNGPFYRRSTDGGGTFAATQDLRMDLGGVPFGPPAIINGTVARMVWPHAASGFASDTDVLFAGQPNCGISWAAPVSGNWNDATKWSPAVIPTAGSTACIAVEGATPYTVTVPAGQNVSELTIGHATSEVRPIVRITGSLTIGSSLVNSGELTFGAGGQIASAAGSVFNTERGRLTTQAGAPASLNATAINYGEVDLAARLTIATAVGRTFTNFGTFTIGPAGSTVFGGGFVFNQNGGVVNVEGAMEFSAEFSTAGDTFNFNGGSVEGVVIIQGHSRLNIGPGSEGKGTFQFERNVSFGISSGGFLSGNIAPAQTIRLMGTVGGSARANVAAGLINAGTIEMTAAATNADGAELVIQGGTVVNTGTIVVQRAGDVAVGRIDGFVENRGTLDIRDDLTFGSNGRITNLGTTTIGAEAAVAFGSNYVVNQNAGVLHNAGRMELSAEFSTGGDTFNFNGGTVEGTVIIQGHSRLNIGPGSEGAGTFQFERNSANATLTGNIAPGQTLRLIGTRAGNTAHSAAVVAANGFTNGGTIVMDSETAGSGGASLVVTAGTLVNTGTIAVDATIPQRGRAIDANIDNRGIFTIRDNLSFHGTNRAFTNTGTVRVFDGATVTVGSAAVFNQQAGVFDLGGALVLNTEFNTGPDTFNFNGGDIEGAAGVHLRSTSRLNIAPGAADGKGRFVYRAPAGGTMSGNLGPQMTLRIQASSVTVANGLTNAGDIVLAVESSPTQGATLAVTAGTLVNTGAITVEPTATDAPLNAVIENHGRITIKDTINLSRVNANHINRGVVEIASGNTLTLMGNSTLRNLAPGGFGGGGTLSIANGSIFTAAGALAISVTNAGRFRPGASPGIVNITGRYTQAASGRLEIEIAGAAAGSGFDQVNVGDVATLAGTLDVQVAAGFCIEANYPFLTYAAVAGDFPTRVGLTASGGRSLVPSRGANVYALNASGPACNEAPVANPDAYSTDEGIPLIVAAPGVLGNDTDAQGDALTAIIAAGPTNGTLTLNPDGSFTYTPNPGFSGTDGFTYRASDGTAQSGVAAVMISVLATAPPVITSLTPERLTVGLVRPLQISGAHFSAPTITLRKGDLEVRGNVLLSTPTTIHAEFDVTAVPPGNWTVIVENQNGRRVDAPIFIEPAIILVRLFWDGIQGFPVEPAGRVARRANYLTVLNVGLTDGVVPVTIDLPHPRMRLKVGAHSEPMHTGGSVTFLVWAPVGVEVRVPLYWGISSEDVNFPGVPPDPTKPTFGQMLSFQAYAPMGLTAGSGQVSEMLVRLFGQIFVDNELPLTLLYRVAHEATSTAKEEWLLKPGAHGLDELLSSMLDHLRDEPVWQSMDIDKRAGLSTDFDQKVREAMGRDVWNEEHSELGQDLLRGGEISVNFEDLQALRNLKDETLSFYRSHEALHDARLKREKTEAAERWKQAQVTKFWASYFDAMSPEQRDKQMLLFHLAMTIYHQTVARFNGIMRGAFDPNDKTANTSLFCHPAIVGGTSQCAPYFVGPEHTVDPIEYVIQFENLAAATAPAETVVVTDVLDDDLDPSTLQIVTTSHPGTESNPNRFSFDVSGNVATFRWTGIDLPPNVESPEGEGYVMFTIEPRPGLASGTEIRNSASIVFDANPAIVTPEVVHVIDTAPPVTTATPSVDPNVHGWNRTDVNVTLRGDDGANGSGVKQIHLRVDGGAEQVIAGAVAVVPLTTEGVHTISYFAVDNVGNTEVERVMTVRIDKTAPVATGAPDRAPDVNGWYNASVTISFSCEDALSGVDTCGATPQTIDQEGANLSRTGVATDLAGNTAQATVGGINLDMTAPVVACSNSAPVLSPPNHKLVAIQTAIKLTDNLSGGLGFTLLQATSNEPDNGLGDGDTANDIQGFTIGTPDASGQLRAERSGGGVGRIYSLLYEGTDRAGNTAACTTLVTVPHNQGNGKK